MLCLTRYWFISTKYRQHSKLALFTFVLAFIVIILGAYTRLTNAGLSCPDWPHCYGFISAPHNAAQLHSAMQQYPFASINIKKAWTEMTHRYFAGTEGILIFILSLSIFFSRARNSKSIFMAIILLILLGMQITLGMLTVTEKLKPVIVLSHLLTGLSILSMLWWVYLDSRSHNGIVMPHASMRVLPGLWFGLLILTIQITFGGWVSTHYAGLACVDLPYCNGQLFPSMQWHHLNSDLITIHMLHRIGAIITASYLSILAFFLIRIAALRTIAVLIFTFVLAQITLGILNIVWLRPISIAMLHQAVAILLLLTIIAALVKVSSLMVSRHDAWIR